MRERHEPGLSEADERDDGLRAWLRAEFSRAAGVSQDAYRPEERFRHYGIDSAQATAILGRLSRRLNRKLAATLVWEYPTLDALADYLEGEGCSEGRGGGSASSIAPRSDPRGRVQREDARPSHEPIAIVGLACRFPGGGDSPEAFWSLLRDGVDTIREVPAQRWDVTRYYDEELRAPGKMNTRWGGFLERVDQFDPGFFGISPREAEHMDPQQRLILEVAWEALEHAHHVPHLLRGTRTGVFLGAMWSDYARLIGPSLVNVDQHTATGQDTSILAGRVSYTLGLEGPSMTVNTACSSSLVAVHLACQSLRRGESALALAGGVSLIVSPASTVVMSKFGAMSPDGRCKAFDARANGYVRGEGAGIVVLKPLSRALLDGDAVICVIRGSAVNNDGFSNGLTAPSPKAQQAVLRDAYRDAGVEPHRVHYVETHGPGTILGDPIEASSLGAVLGAGRDASRPLILGSVKTNLGHLEASAGAAGLIKTALAMRHRAIPRNLHFEVPNPHIDWSDLHLQVARERQPWPHPDEAALAGVSSFGFGGTNCHVVLEGMPSPALLFPLSAPTAEGLARSVLELLPTVAGLDDGDAALAALAARLRSSAEDGEHRAAFVARCKTELFDAVTARIRKPRGAEGPAWRGRSQVVFVCAGQGSQWLGMGRSLVATEPAFRAELLACDAEFRRRAGFSVMEELVATPERSRLEEVEVVQPVLFSLQVSLGALWRSWGVDPDAVIGQSMGEIGAAYLAGILRLEDAAQIICARSRLANTLSGKGGMAAVALPAAQAEALVEAHREQVAVAAYNSPGLVVLSGEQTALESVLLELERRNVDVSRVKVAYASHCPQIDELRGPLAESLAGIAPRAASTRMVSTVTEEELCGPECTAEYWFRNLRQPVRFAQVVGALLAERETVFVELSPHPILVRPIEEIRRGSSERARPGLALGSLRRGEDERFALLQTLGALFECGRLRPVVRPAPAAVPLLLSAKSEAALRARAAQIRDL
ncbi:MAG TPA: beta-ketoacyl synthase N-terminal-like domain-containing protein, partial [Kofleriaceae bacterium]